MNATSAGGTALRSNPDFLRLWTGATISAVGSQITAFALPITAILVLNASPFQVGLLMAATYAPLTLFGLFAGAWADRGKRRPLLVIADLSRAAIIASVPAAYAWHVLALPQLYIVAVTAGSLTVLFDVAHGSYLPALVDRDMLIAANARLQVSEQGASVLGPALGASLVTAVAAPLALLIDAFTFLASAASLLAIRHHETAPARGGETTIGILPEIADGVVYVASRPSLRAFAMSSALSNFFLWMISAVLVLHLVRTAGLRPSVVGAVLSIGEAGFFIGALAIRRIRRHLPLSATLTAASLVIAFSGLPIAFAPIPLAVPLTALGLFAYGFAAVSWTVSASGYRQATTPAELLGRAGSVALVASRGTVPIAAVVAGAVAAVGGTRTAMILGAVGAVTTALPVVAWRLGGAPD